MRFTITVLFIIITNTCWSQGHKRIPLQQSDSFLFTERPTEELPNSVSMIELMAHPKKHDGEFVMVSGYMQLQRECGGLRLYLHKDDYDYGNYKNSMVVDFAPGLDSMARLNKFHKAYVTIIGVFNAHWAKDGMSSGGIFDICQIGIQHKRED